MGMDQTVHFTNGAVPSWEAVVGHAKEQGLTLEMRMINGELAFPDEEPGDDWNEIRVGSSAGMITVKREPNQVMLVIWGNADPEMTKHWHLLTWAFAKAGSGMIHSEGSELDADTFQQQRL